VERAQRRHRADAELLAGEHAGEDLAGVAQVRARDHPVGLGDSLGELHGLGDRESGDSAAVTDESRRSGLHDGQIGHR